MWQIIVLIAAIALGGCATNPLQNSSFWRIESCTDATSLDVRLNRADDSIFVIVSRASCSAVVSANRKIEGVANYHANQILIAGIPEPNAFATLDKSQRPVIVVTTGMLTALRNDEPAWAALLGHEIAHHVMNHSEGRAAAMSGAKSAGEAGACQ